MMISYQERVIDEKQELDAKRENLIGFIQSESFAALPELQQTNLRFQLMFMDGYSTALAKRIESFLS